MKYFTVGWRRLYECVGYAIPEDIEANGSISLVEGNTATIYIGRNPKFKLADPIIPNLPIVGKPMTWISTDLGGKVLLELTVSHRCELSSKIEPLLKVQDESCISNLIETNIDRKYSRQTLDAIAGSIGVLVNKQMVLNMLGEGDFIEYKGIWKASSTSGAFDILDSLQINQNHTSPLEIIIDLLPKLSSDDIREMGGKFHWLLKAWTERDPIARFVYSFIPLETLLPSGKPDGIAMGHLANLRQLVSDAESTNDDLQIFLNMVEGKFGTSLVDRFKTLSLSHYPDDWEVDYNLFKSLNRTRNILLHQGKTRTDENQLQAHTKSLQDLSIKYIKKIYFEQLN